jgi:threonine/homoserine efflux transporter RhtA
LQAGQPCGAIRGSLLILETAVSAALVLGETLSWPTMLGLMLVLIGVCRNGAGSNPESQSDRPAGRYL